jgi:hypothetical protein
LQFNSTSSLTTTGGGSLTSANTGTLTLGGTFNLNGGLSQTGAGGVSLSGSVTAQQIVTFAGVVTLSGTPSITTADQTINFSNTVLGPGALTLNAGTNGDILMSGTIGTPTPLGNFTITNGHNITLQPINASTVTFTNFSGTATYQSITTTGSGGVNLTGSNFIRNGSLNISGGGSLVVNNSGFIKGFGTNTTAIDGSYTQTGTGPYDLSGSITVGANISLQSAVTLVTNATLTSSGNGTITISNVIDGGQSLTLTVGSGNISLGSAVGSINRINALNLNCSGTIGAQAITAASITQTGTATANYNGDLNTNGAAGITLSGTNITRLANWTTTSLGPITVTVPLGGSFVSTAAGTINSAGAFRQIGSGAVSLGRTINTTNANISFAGPITLASATTLNTSGTGTGDITLSSTLDGSFDLNLFAGTGNIMMQGTVGNAARLGIITVNTATNVTTPSLKAASFSQLSGSGITTLNGPTDTNTSAGVSIVGTTVNINGILNATSGGVLTVNNAATFNLAASATVAGNVSQTGVGATVLSGTVTSTAGSITFAGAVSTSGTPQLFTSSQPILFSGTLNGPASGTGNLNLNAGSAGSITVVGATGAVNRLGNLSIANAQNVSIQAITAGSITQSAGTGTTSIIGTINTNNSIGLSLTGSAFNINGSIITTNSGPMTVIHSGVFTLNAGASTLLSTAFNETGTGTVVLSGNLHANDSDISFNRPITLLASTTLNSDGAGDITLSSPVDGAADLILNSGDGDISALVPIGGTTPINNLIIVNTDTANFALINAQTITQQAGIGTTTFNGAITTSLPNGIQLTGNTFVFSAPVTTTGNGQVIINNTGVLFPPSLTIASGATMNLTGAFQQIGVGAVSLAANITTDNDAISFAGPVTLANPVSIATSSAAGSIMFFNTVMGNQNLTLAAGAGSISFSQPVSAIAALTVTSAQNFTSQSISAFSINFSGVANLSTFGTLSTTGGTGIVLNGDAFTFNQNITTTNGGPLTITNSGPVIFNPLASVTLDGAFTQTGSGLVNAGGTLTTNNQPISFTANILLNGDYTISTGSTGANVTFVNEIDGPYNLTINAGLGDVTFQNAIGTGSAFQNVTVASANAITMSGLGTALSGVTGALSLTATGNINLNNSFYTSGSQTYNAGQLNFVNGALTTLTTTGGGISFANAPVVLSSGNDLSIVTNNGAFTFNTIQGTTFENLIFNTGSGTTTMGAITGSHINNILVNAGQIVFTAPITAVNTDFESQGAIFNQSTPFAINSTNTATFNALNGNVGSAASPILVNTSNQIFAGAGGAFRSLAAFNGSSVDDTVNVITSNPPCVIIFNGVVIKDCGEEPGEGGSTVNITQFPFAVPGFDSSSFNLASDYFFLFYFFGPEFVHKYGLMYYIPSAK